MTFKIYLQLYNDPVTFCAHASATTDFIISANATFQIGKGVCQDVYCHPAYLTYMQSTS